MISRTVFAAVFLMVTITTTVVTFILPEYYAGTVRVHVNGDVTQESATVQSMPVLKDTIDKLDLNGKWGKKYNNGAPLRTEDSAQWLKRRLTIRSDDVASLLAITVYSEDRDEAAQLANAIAGVYQQSSTNKVEIVEQAKPALAPAKPDKTLNIGIGIAVGLFLGAGVGWLVALLGGGRR